MLQIAIKWLEVANSLDCSKWPSFRGLDCLKNWDDIGDDFIKISIKYTQIKNLHSFSGWIFSESVGKKI